MKNAAVAEKSHSQEALESLHTRFKAEIERRQTNSDLDEALAMVCCGREVNRLATIASDPNQPAETRLGAALCGLDLAGMTARSARICECEPSELTLLELQNVLARIEIEMCDEAVG